MAHRSDDPKPGDRVRMNLGEGSAWTGVEGIVRHVYKGIRREEIMISVVVSPIDATDKIKKEAVQSDDGGYHIMCLHDEFEVISKVIYT